NLLLPSRRNGSTSWPTGARSDGAWGGRQRRLQAAALRFLGAVAALSMERALEPSDHHIPLPVKIAPALERLRKSPPEGQRVVDQARQTHPNGDRQGERPGPRSDEPMQGAGADATEPRRDHGQRSDRGGKHGEAFRRERLIG